MDDKFYGLALRHFRKTRTNWSLTALAVATGIHLNTLSSLELHGTGMRLDLFLQICAILGLDPAQVADYAYFNFRQHVKEEKEKAAASPPAATAKVVPSREDILRLHESATAANRDLLLGVLGFLQPDFAISTSVAELLKEAEAESSPASPPEAKPKRRTGSKKTTASPP